MWKLVSGEQKTLESFDKKNFTAKCNVYFAMHAYNIAGPSYFNSETVGEVDYYKMLDSYVQSEP